MEFIDLVFIKSGDLYYALLYFLIFSAVSFTFFWFALRFKKGKKNLTNKYRLDLIFGFTLAAVILSSYFFYNYAKSPLSDATIERLISNGHLTSDVFDRVKFDIKSSVELRDIGVANKKASAEDLYSISYMKISNAILYVEKYNNELSYKKDLERIELKIMDQIEKNQGFAQ